MTNMEISVSFTKNINLANYGGAAYESENIFVAMKDNIPDGSEEQVIIDKTDELYYKCVESVETFLKERITLLKQ